MEKTPTCTIQPPVEDDDLSVGSARSVDMGRDGAAVDPCWAIGLGCSCGEVGLGGAGVCACVAAVGEPSGGTSESPCSAGVDDSAIGVGCSGPLACGDAFCVPVDESALCESSARFMVYERNGGSSEEVAAACGAGTDRDGPLSSSGTNNTISTTRMIAPVSRSFTRLSKIGAEPLHSSVRALRPRV
jgi:hypothetical protein